MTLKSIRNIRNEIVDNNDQRSKHTKVLLVLWKPLFHGMTTFAFWLSFFFQPRFEKLISPISTIPSNSMALSERLFRGLFYLF